MLIITEFARFCEDLDLSVEEIEYATTHYGLEDWEDELEDTEERITM